jgi:hypothetical protein
MAVASAIITVEAAQLELRMVAVYPNYATKAQLKLRAALPWNVPRTEDGLVLSLAPEVIRVLLVLFADGMMTTRIRCTTNGWTKRVKTFLKTPKASSFLLEVRADVNMCVDGACIGNHQRGDRRAGVGV